MTSSNLKTYIKIQSLLVQVEGMKAENERRTKSNEYSQAYSELDFDSVAREIEELIEKVY